MTGPGAPTDPSAQGNAAPDDVPTQPHKSPQTRKIAVWLGAPLVGLGFLAALAGIVLQIMGRDPGGSKLLLMFGMMIFGVGLSLFLTQIFVEKYRAKIAGLAFAGTLAALAIFMTLVQTFFFEDNQTTIDRDLKLVVECPHPSDGPYATLKNSPLVAFRGMHDDSIKELTAALQRRGSDTMLDKTARDTRFKQVKGKLLVEPIEEGEFVFFLPEAIRENKSLKFDILRAQDEGGQPDNPSLASNLIQHTLIKVDIERGNSEDDKAHPQITAEISFKDLATACGL